MPEADANISGPCHRPNIADAYPNIGAEASEGISFKRVSA
jgi:hypothetical protein